MLKGKQVVSLVKRFSNDFFQCLQSLPPAYTRSLQLPFVEQLMIVNKMFLKRKVGVTERPRSLNPSKAIAMAICLIIVHFST